MTSKDIDHLAFSISHGTFDSNPSTGGCSCELCTELRKKIEALRSKEATDYYNEHYPPTGGFL